MVVFEFCSQFSDRMASSHDPIEFPSLTAATRQGPRGDDIDIAGDVTAPLLSPSACAALALGASPSDRALTCAHSQFGCIIPINRDPVNEQISHVSTKLI